jgi:hypothetical protein
MRITSVFTTSRPLSASNASARSVNAPRASATAVVIHTRPAATTGDDQPAPGTGTFHRTFVFSLHCTGSARSVECPWPSGPRN